MKRFGLILIIVFVIVAAALLAQKIDGGSVKDSVYLRVHIRANSNADIDQGVKYAVKERVVDLLTPKVQNADTVDAAIDIIKKNIIEIERVADEVLLINGFNYKSKARLAVEEFPMRSYEDLVLEGGLYDALVIDLGTGEGDNWWCVIYPPLCFVGRETDGSTIKYKSFIYELFTK